MDPNQQSPTQPQPVPANPNQDMPSEVPKKKVFKFQKSWVTFALGSLVVIVILNAVFNLPAYTVIYFFIIAPIFTKKGRSVLFTDIKKRPLIYILILLAFILYWAFVVIAVKTNIFKKT